MDDKYTLGIAKEVYTIYLFREIIKSNPVRIIPTRTWCIVRKVKIDGASKGYKKTSTDFHKYETQLLNNSRDSKYNRENKNARIKLKIVEF